MVEILSNQAMSSELILNIITLSIISLSPILLSVCTSFTRFTISFSFLKNSIGLQNAPSNIVIITLSVLMTIFVMKNTFDQSYIDGIEPYLLKKIPINEAIPKIIKPFNEFMKSHIKQKEYDYFADTISQNNNAQNDNMTLLVTAFILSEVKHGFEAGLLISLPFLAIDIIVATIIMSLGMMMLPPSVISLPIKVLFFLSIDGWSLFIGSLIKSYL